MPDEQLDLAKMVKIYLKIKTARDELTAKFKEKDEALDKQMTAIKHALLDYCKSTNSEGSRTDEGLFFRTVNTRYWTADWEAMGKFVVENNLTDLYEKRLHQGNVEAYLKDNPDNPPPGLNVESKYGITVRRK